MIGKWRLCVTAELHAAIVWSLVLLPSHSLSRRKKWLAAIHAALSIYLKDLVHNTNKTLILCIHLYYFCINLGKYLMSKARVLLLIKVLWTDFKIMFSVSTVITGGCDHMSIFLFECLDFYSLRVGLEILCLVYSNLCANKIISKVTTQTISFGLRILFYLHRDLAYQAYNINRIRSQQKPMHSNKKNMSHP